MSGPTMKILYGAPGTGKTWQAAREAVKAVDPIGYAAALKTSDSNCAIRNLHTKLVEDGRILWITFHPSYSYEDFVEGYRPITDDRGQLAYRVVDGPFKTLCLRAKFEVDLQIGDQLHDSSGRPAGSVVDKDAGGWVVRVTPNRADEVAVTVDKYVPRYVIDRVLERGFSPRIFSIPGKSILELSDFGIDPNDSDVEPPKADESETTRHGSVIRKIIAARTGMFSSSDLSNASHYGSVVRRMAELRLATSSRGAAVAIVIDEINRAEPSRVFGELLTLLEVDKRQGQPEERKVLLPYSKTLFSVPNNVSVIGTMNTVDRSLTALDFAMRRRFEFELIEPNPALLPEIYAQVDIRSILKRINARIEALLGKGYEFGHAPFMEGRLNEIRVRQGWQELPDGELRTIAYVFRSTLLPTISEYFHGDLKKICAIVGEVSGDKGVISLFKIVAHDPAFLERLSDDYELPDSATGSYEDWWDPAHDKWDLNRYLAFLVALSSGF